MGRIAYKIDEYFDYNENLNESTCRKCNKKIKGKLVGNLKRHFKMVHNMNVFGGTQLKNKCPILKSKIMLTKSEFIKCCVGLVTVKSVPFKIFEDKKYFKKLIAPLENAHGLNINSKNITTHLQTCSAKIKDTIKEKLLNKLLSLKIDIGTRMDKHILGINAQIISNGKIEILNLGMIQINKKHTAQNLKDEVLKCLEEYNVHVTQIYFCTTDNASNVIKMSELLKNLQDEPQPSEEFADLNDKEFEFLSNEISSFLSIVRCAAHTLQLVCHDVFKVISDDIDELRTQIKAFRNVIKSKNLDIQMPTLDTPTRWNSTYTMIESLHRVKSSCNEHFKNYNAINWSFIDNFLAAFKPLASCTVKAQAQQYIIGDFYRDWMCAKLDVEEEIAKGNIYSKQILPSMIKREQKLIETDAFVAALYIDPRFNFVETPFLTIHQKNIAMDHLLLVNKKITLLSESNSSNLSPNTPENISECPTGQYAKLEQKVLQCSSSSGRVVLPKSIRESLDSLCFGERLSFDADVLQFWNQSKIKNEEMSNLTNVVLAVPPTQVSVERSFSSLSVVLTKQRSRLSKTTINDILLVKLNEDILDEIQLI